MVSILTRIDFVGGGGGWTFAIFRLYHFDAYKTRKGPFFKVCRGKNTRDRMGYTMNRCHTVMLNNVVRGVS